MNPLPKFLLEMPDVDMEREVRHLPVFVSPEHFAAIYRACDRARYPQTQGYTAGEWWRALLVMIYQATGWRIGQLLEWKKEDLDVELGTAIARGESEGNKGRSDVRFKLHPVAVDHLKKLIGFGDLVFAWPLCRRRLDIIFHEIQVKAGIRLPCKRNHEHTEACQLYGFHHLRKAFGTLNAPRLQPTDLQWMMQHESFQTTQQYYVNPLAEQEAAVAKLSVPEFLSAAQ